LLGALAYAGFRAWQAEARRTCAGVAVVALAALIGTFAVRAHQARALVIFGGDGGCFLLGTLMMASIFVAPGSALHRGWLRWGFLFIGAFAFMDAFADWWDAGHSREGVVFGEIEGVGDSDPTRLVFEYGWSEAKVVARYMRLAWTGLAALAALYLAQWRRED
jgi:hypothetical protein